MITKVDCGMLTVHIFDLEQPQNISVTCLCGFCMQEVCKHLILHVAHAQ